MPFKSKRSKYYKTNFQLFLWNVLNQEHGGYADIAKFLKLFDESRQVRENIFKTFPDFLNGLIDNLDGDDRDSKERQFFRKTKLTKKFLNDCKCKPNVRPKMRTVITIIMGLDLDSTDKNNALILSGHSLVGNDTLTQAYIFLLAQRGKEDFNKLVKEHKSVIPASNYILSEIFEANFKHEYEKTKKIKRDFVLGKHSG